jgi:hypothetical protein
MIWKPGTVSLTTNAEAFVPRSCSIESLKRDGFQPPRFSTMPKYDADEPAAVSLDLLLN